MANKVVNYDGSITAFPRQLAYPQSVEEIQAILRDPARFPEPCPSRGELPLAHAVCIIRCHHYQHNNNE